jgi:class 3 adenylate cyclase
MGDGVLAYFGWPLAHEDEAERAVRAGLALVGAMSGLSTPSGEPLAARVGIATGLVVVGDLVGERASQEQAVVGDTPNLAARLQALAEPSQVLIARPRFSCISRSRTSFAVIGLRLDRVPSPP